MEEQAYYRENKLPEEEDEEKDEHKTVSFEKSSDLVKLVRKGGEKQFRAVKWRDGHKIKDSEKNIDKNYHRRDSHKSGVVRNTETQKQAENKGDDNIGGWSSDCHDCFRPASGSKIIRIVGYWLGPAEDETAQKVGSGWH